MTSDAICYSDLDALGRETDDPVEQFAQDIYHRLVETPGSNADDPDRGLGLDLMLSGPVEPAVLTRQIEAELLKDERTGAVRATVAEVDGAGAYRIEIEIESAAGDVKIALDNATGLFRRSV